MVHNSLGAPRPLSSSVGGSPAHLLALGRGQVYRPIVGGSLAAIASYRSTSTSDALCREFSETCRAIRLDTRGRPRLRYREYLCVKPRRKSPETAFGDTEAPDQGSKHRASTRTRYGSPQWRMGTRPNPTGYGSSDCGGEIPAGVVTRYSSADRARGGRPRPKRSSAHIADRGRGPRLILRSNRRRSTSGSLEGRPRRSTTRCIGAANMNLSNGGDALPEWRSSSPTTPGRSRHGLRVRRVNGSWRST
jgi:hypothetical protein